jgi:hypothetical protein
LLQNCLIEKPNRESVVLRRLVHGDEIDTPPLELNQKGAPVAIVLKHLYPNSGLPGDRPVRGGTMAQKHNGKQWEH